MSLVLTRRPEESIVIDTGNGIIEIVTGRVTNGNEGWRQVKLIFNAPRHMEIYRKEIWERKQKEKTKQTLWGKMWKMIQTRK